MTSKLSPEKEVRRYYALCTLHTSVAYEQQSVDYEYTQVLHMLHIISTWNPADSFISQDLRMSCQRVMAPMQPTFL